MQEYLKDRRLKTSMAKAVFKFKTRMANFSENFKEGGQTKPCPMCKEPNALDTQRHSLMCKVIFTNIEIETSYEEIFYSKAEVKAAKTVANILKFREEFLKSQPRPTAHKLLQGCCAALKFYLYLFVYLFCYVDRNSLIMN